MAGASVIRKTQGAGREGFKWGKSLEVLVWRDYEKRFKEVRPLLLELHMISFVFGNASTLPKPDVLDFKRLKSLDRSKNYRFGTQAMQLRYKRKTCAWIPPPQVRG